MASRNTRNKIRFQARSAQDDLRHALDHMVSLAALADDNSDYINNQLPEIIAALDMLKLTFIEFSEGL